MSGTPETSNDAVLDFQREARIGLSEAVFCTHKTPEQIAGILACFRERGRPCLITRLDGQKADALPAGLRECLDYDPLSRTAFFLDPEPAARATRVAVVSGGTSDAPVCAEAVRTLAFYGVRGDRFQDLGVTGLWRILERVEEIRGYPVVIVVAGMEGALFSVLGGLISSVLIAVPTSVGYGAAPNGQLSLQSALGSCAPGLVTVNIDNGYGAACAALRFINQLGPGG